MKVSRRNALKVHRRHQKSKGFVRVEVQALATDAALLREVAAQLGSGTRRASEVRSLLRRSLRPHKSLRELIALELPDDVLDQVLTRPRDPGREVEL